MVGTLSASAIDAVSVWNEHSYDDTETKNDIDFSKKAASFLMQLRKSFLCSEMHGHLFIGRLKT